MEECNQIFSIILCVRQECISLSRPLFSVHLHVTIRFHIHISLSFFMTFCSVFVLCKEQPRFMHVLQSNPSNTIYERIEGKKQQIVFFVVFIISLIANARICNLHVVQNIHFDRAKNSELVCFFFLHFTRPQLAKHIRATETTNGEITYTFADNWIENSSGKERAGPRQRMKR